MHLYGVVGGVLLEDHKLCTWLVSSPKLAARKNNAGNGIIVIVCAAFIVNHYH